MTTPGLESGESEFSPGPGMVAHPGRKVERKDLPYPDPVPGATRREQLAQKWAEMRTDSTDATSTADLFVKGNPDRFGGQPALVQESATLPPSNFDPTAPGGVRGNVPQMGVEREG